MNHTLLFLSALAISQPSFSEVEPTDTTPLEKTPISEETTKAETPYKLETIKVNADFRKLDVSQIPSAITVVGEQQIQNRNADHLESILSLAPNVNFSAGASRGRFFQIRGIGERSQFIDPVNPSVGLIIDGIDMTGLGGAATLFDIQQVEILRGPQGTAFGANALAGAINITSNLPTKETEGYIEAKLGNYNTQGLGGAVSGSISENVQARFAINQFKTDGYMKNTFLNKEDTNNIDELVARAQLNWQINESNDLNFSLLQTDINNGYDAFSLDNNRTTSSNNPGQDKQDTTALSALWKSKLNDALNLELNLSSNKTETNYGYDEDWAYGEYIWLDDSQLDINNEPIYQPDPCDTTQGPCLATEDGYSSIDQYLRNYTHSTLNLRLLSGADGQIFNNSTNWVVGFYSSDKTEKLTRKYTYLYGNDYTSEFDTSNRAVYAELSSNVSATSKLIYGLRIEEASFEFSDNNGLNKDKNETLWGGKFTYETILNHDHLTYASLARGFKAGSINREPLIPEADKLYDTEFNNSLESGIKSSLLNDTLQTSVSVFYIQRKNQQVKQSFLYYDDGKPKFKDYFANAAEGINYGLEAESSWDINKKVNWTLSLGLLKTELTDYEFSSKDSDDNLITINKSGRAQGHAPEYSIATSFSYKVHNNITLQIETEAKDTFYYSDSHDQKSEAYQLWHANISYQKNNLEISLSAKNITDQDYTVKGFYFGNDPRDGYTAKTYEQFGSPRLITLQTRYNF